MEVVYEDKDIVVVNKPAGVVVNRDAGLPGFENYLVVHRLDKDTSGLLLLAKTSGALAELQGQFKKRTVKKSYLALVHGRLTHPTGVVDAPLRRIGGLKFGVVADGRSAVTKFRVVEYFGDSYTLVEARPLTGRTHQIRVHLKHLGHPIVGDKIYSSRRQQQEDTKVTQRQFLHAYRLGFTHPRTGEWLRFEVGLAEDLQHCVNRVSGNRGVNGFGF